MVSDWEQQIGQIGDSTILIPPQSPMSRLGELTRLELAINDERDKTDDFSDKNFSAKSEIRLQARLTTLRELALVASRVYISPRTLSEDCETQIGYHEC